VNAGSARQLPDFRAGARYLSTAVQPRLDGLWLIRDWVPALGLSVIWGASGVCKSHLAADMAAHVALGREWHGNPVEPGFVAYVALEGHGSLDNRIAALAQSFGDAPVWFMPTALSLGVDIGHVDALAATIAEEAADRPVRWLIVDTLARAMAGAEENSARDMGFAVGGLDALARTLECAVTVVHHSGKDASRGERGSGVLRAAA
jgi:RecA-family ATPase